MPSGQAALDSHRQTALNMSSPPQIPHPTGEPPREQMSAGKTNSRAKQQRTLDSRRVG